MGLPIGVVAITCMLAGCAAPLQPVVTATQEQQRDTVPASPTQEQRGTVPLSSSSGLAVEPGVVQDARKPLPPNPVATVTDVPAPAARSDAPEPAKDAPGGGSRREVIAHGKASWYGAQFHQRKTANGERFDMMALTAAHKTLPFNTQVCVRNLANGSEVLVRINDRGPYVQGRMIDLSRAAADRIGMISSGVTQVALTVVDRRRARCGSQGTDLADRSGLSKLPLGGD